MLDPQTLAARLKNGVARLGVAAVRMGVEVARPEPARPADESRVELLADRSWTGVLKAVWARVKQENVSFLAAGLAYYGILAIVPGLIATVSVYGLVGDPGGVAGIIDDLDGAVPTEVQVFIEGQLTSILETSTSSLGVSFGLSLAAGLWAASNGTKALIRGINLAYGIDETRGYLKLRLLAIGLTVGLLAYVGGILTLVTFGHRWLDGSAWFNPVLQYGRWPLALVATVGVLAGFYRFAPSRRSPDWSVASLGAVVAAITWLLASIGLSFYVSRFGSFNETYGTLGAVIVVLLWLFVSAFIVLLGAVLDRTLSRRPQV